MTLCQPVDVFSLDRNSVSWFKIQVLNADTYPFGGKNPVDTEQ